MTTTFNVELQHESDRTMQIPKEMPWLQMGSTVIKTSLPRLKIECKPRTRTVEENVQAFTGKTTRTGLRHTACVISLNFSLGKNYMLNRFQGLSFVMANIELHALQRFQNSCVQRHLALGVVPFSVRQK